MRWGIAVAGFLLLAAGPAAAQNGPFRHFTELPTDINRGDRIVYLPLAAAFPGPRPPSAPYDVSAATWYRQPLGARGAAPDKVLDDGQYVLERFEVMRRPNAAPAFVAVITRTPAPPEGTAPPLLRVVNTNSSVSSSAMPAVERTGDSVRLTYVLMPPHFGFTRPGDLPAADRYELRFLPARDVRLPASLARFPTLGGADVETLRAAPPPRLTPAERTAGRRIEYRRGRVIDER